MEGQGRHSLIDSDYLPGRPSHLTQGELGSLSDVLNQERYLIEMGQMPAPSMDDLVAFALMQPGVRQAQVLWDPVGKRAVYQVRPKGWIRYRVFAWLRGRRGIIAKLGLLLMARAGAPASAEAFISRLASDYLPEGYSVSVQFHRRLPAAGDAAGALHQQGPDAGRG